ncbi:CMD domain protein [Sinorhizobium fredii]|uniref:CMD domain protein n=1 Tax=Rhizobium fredii TaxID=380 RepID=UPI0004B10EC3|nr:CMD domain protein [Sinorhizobium fredii]
MSISTPDVIDLLAGVTPGSALDGVRAQRPQTREQAQQSYLALFQPSDITDVSQEERHAVANFVAGLHRHSDAFEFYAAALEETGDPRLLETLKAEVGAALPAGPYGHYPAGPLTAEDQPGPTFRVSDAGREALGSRLTAAFEHAHLLVFHPRDARPEALQALFDAGWTATGVVTLSQLVSFVAFQVRVIAGLAVLASATKRATA